MQVSFALLSVRTTVRPGSLGLMKHTLFRCTRGRRGAGTSPTVAIGRRGFVLTIGSLFAGAGGCGSFGRPPSARSSDGGFFGWHINAPFDTSEVKTVSVFFKTQSFRRDVEKQLTEAVEKEISMRTPYRGRRQPRESRLGAHRPDHLRRQKPGG